MKTWIPYGKGTSVMEVENLSNMVGGWFVGNFKPSVLKTAEFEVALKRYVKGDVEAAHYQKIATEISVVVSGKIRLGEMTFHADDIITIPPNVIADFECLEDCVVVAIKTPSLPSDKVIA
jgi:quercetin dioxygenase-like cupin family protein